MSHMGTHNPEQQARNIKTCCPEISFRTRISMDAAFLLTVGSFLLLTEFFCLQLCLGTFLLTI